MASIAAVAIAAIALFAAKGLAPVAGGIALRVVATAFGRVVATAAATAAATAIAPAAKVATSAGIAALSAAFTIPPPPDFYVNPPLYPDDLIPPTPEAMSAYRAAYAAWKQERDAHVVPEFARFDEFFAKGPPIAPVWRERYACDL